MLFYWALPTQVHAKLHIFPKIIFDIIAKSTLINKAIHITTFSINYLTLHAENLFRYFNTHYKKSYPYLLTAFSIQIYTYTSLQTLDDRILTDGKGSTAYLKIAMLVMTSNLGSSRTLDMSSDEKIDDDVNENMNT